MTEGYDEIFESWEPLLKDPNQVKISKLFKTLERKGKINLGSLGRVFFFIMMRFLS